MKRSVLAAAVVLGLLFSGLLAVAPAAAASGDRGYATASTTLFGCQDSRCSSIRSVPSGASFTTSCWRDGNAYAGSSRWFRVTYNGSQGWVSTGAVRNPQPSVPYCSDLLPGEQIFNGESVWSQDGRYRVVMQDDGNLVVYGPGGATWASNTNGGGYFAAMQSDGNFVVYNASYQATFATGTGFPGTSIVMQSDSNLVAYGSPGAVWASNWHVYSGQATRSWNAGASGNCTWWAMEQWKGFWGRHTYPALNGDAGAWDDSARALGYRVSSVPATQAVVVLEPFLTPGYPGHVAWVKAVGPRSDGTWIDVTEMNHAGLGVTDERWIKVVDGMSFITAPAI